MYVCLSYIIESTEKVSKVFIAHQKYQQLRSYKKPARITIVLVMKASVHIHTFYRVSIDIFRVLGCQCNIRVSHLGRLPLPLLGSFKQIHCATKFLICISFFHTTQLRS